MLPLLARYGLRAVFAVPVASQSAEHRGDHLVPLEHWKEVCVRGGHELAAHGVTHTSLTSLTDGALHTELAASQKATAATTLVYPGGAHDDRVAAAAAQYFRAARTTRRGFEQLPPRDPFRLRTFVARKGTYRVWLWNLRAAWAALTNRWLIECYHNVSLGRDADDGRRHTVPLDALEKHLAFLKRLPIRIAPLRDIVHP